MGPSSTGETFLVAGYSVGRLSSFFLLNGTVLKEGVEIKSVEYSSQHLLVTCVDGGVRWLPLVGASLGKEPPTLWNVVHGDNKVSIGCCSIKIIQGRCLCATGAEDSSITLFEFVVHHVLRFLPYSAELHPLIFEKVVNVMYMMLSFNSI